MSVNLSLFAGAGAQFFDNNGLPLNGGLLYSYAAGTSTQAATYTSNSGSISNSNPIVLDSAGRVPNEIWLTQGSTYKFVLQTSAAVQIGSWDNIPGANDLTSINAVSAALTAFETSLASSTGSSLVGYNEGGTGAVTTTVQAKLQQYVSVKDFGAKGDGTTNDTVAISNAISTGKAVYFSAGTYLCNVTINNKTILFGDGVMISKITPYSNSAPALLYTYATVGNPSPGIYWSYHSVVENIGFFGTSNTSGGSIGFSFGTASPTTYTTDAEYANNVQFINCLFKNNYIGVNFPHGNIGTAFYSCGFQNNYYGAYLLDNRTGYGGGGMHAGNKYFYDGEMDGNICAVYISNQTDGFGNVEFNNVIFEYNSLVVYLNDNTSTYVPITFNSCWNEGNGTPQGPSTVTIDSWSGSTLTTQTLSTATPFYIKSQNVTFNSGFVYGINLFSTNSRVYINNSRVETGSGYGGYPFAVVDNSSRIYFSNCYSNSGFTSTSQCISYGLNFSYNSNVTDPGGVNGRSFIVPLGYNVTTGATENGVKLTFTSAAAYAGSASGTGTVVTDGVKYTSCNQFTYNFTATNQYIYPTGTQITTNATAWYAFTVDIKVTSGSAAFQVSDLNSNQLAQTSVISADGLWHTFAGVGYFPNAATVALWTGGIVSNVTWEYSAFQMWQFSSQADAVEFLASRTYLG
jgi:hypothetical protein